MAVYLPNAASWEVGCFGGDTCFARAPLRSHHELLGLRKLIAVRVDRAVKSSNLPVCILDSGNVFPLWKNARIIVFAGN